MDYEEDFEYEDFNYKQLKKEKQLRRKMEQHGKSLGRIYQNVVQKNMKKIKENF